MAHIQMTDHNPSDLGLMEELTDEELLTINGGALGALGGAVAGAGGSLLESTFNNEPISWGSVGAWGLAGAIGGGIAGWGGGPPGASLAGAD
jgi:hypothetical protein